MKLSNRVNEDIKNNVEIIVVSKTFYRGNHFDTDITEFIQDSTLEMLQHGYKLISHDTYVMREALYTNVVFQK